MTSASWFSIPLSVNGREFHVSAMLGLGTALILLAFLPHTIVSVDGRSMLAVAESILVKGDFTVPPALGNPGFDGRFYSGHYPLISVLALPLVGTGIFIADVLNLPRQYVAAPFALVLSALLTAGTTSFVALLAIRLGGSLRSALWAAVGFAFGTVALVYSRTFFAEPLVALLAVCGLYFAFGSQRSDLLLASISAGLAVLAKPTGIVLGPILALYLLMRRKDIRVAVAPVVGTAVGALIYGAYNYIRWGNPLSFGGQSWSAFDVRLLSEGIIGQMFSPGRGVFWYAPAVFAIVLVLRRAFSRKQLETATILILFLAYLVLHSIWMHWEGGWSWGPRFLLPALAGLFSLAGLMGQRLQRVFLVLVALGFVVNSPTLISSYERYFAEAYERGTPSPEALLWSPAAAPLIHVWGASYRQVRDAATTDLGRAVSDDNTDDLLSSSTALRSVAVWWWMLPVLGVSPWIGMAVAFAMIIGGVWIISRGFVLADGNNELRRSFTC